MRVRLHFKPKPNNYTESCVVNVADIWRERDVWYQGRSVRYALKRVSMKNNIENINGWLYHRIRMCIWKQWKKPKTKMRNLMRMGIPKYYAHMAANSRRGHWFNSNLTTVKRAMSKERLVNSGFYDLAASYSILQKCKWLPDAEEENDETIADSVSTELSNEEQIQAIIESFANYAFFAEFDLEEIFNSLPEEYYDHCETAAGWDAATEAEKQEAQKEYEEYYADLRSEMFGEYGTDATVSIEIVSGEHVMQNLLSQPASSARVLDEKELSYFERVSDDMDAEHATTALNRLCGFLYKYYGKKVIVLLDEYDTPMQEAYVDGY